MKNKTFKRLICFLLALVVMVSLPLDLQANALAIEPWLIYAMITYLTAVGFTFTVSGGVDAMINALEEKANEYSNNIVDFYDIMRQNIKLVPNPNRPPNTDFFNLFFTSVGVEAMNAFITWLTSSGNLSEGTNSSSEQFATFFYNHNGVQEVGFVSRGVTEINTVNRNIKAKADEIGTIMPFKKGITEEFWSLPKYTNTEAYYYQYRTNDSGNITNAVNVHNYDGGNSTPVYYLAQFFVDGLYGTITDSVYNHIVGTTLSYEDTSFGVRMRIWFVLDDGYLYRINSDWSEPVQPLGFEIFTSDVDIYVPSDIIKPLPTVEEGFLMSNVELGSESLDEWANMVEELFIQTGTIPNPQPEIIRDPDFAPEPTPAPTPVPTPEVEDIDDLGLPTLGEAIFNKFPFSLPKDLKRIADILNAEPVTPFWEVNLFETLGNRVPFVDDTTIRIDLAEYEALGQISRWASVITFVIFLVIITKGVIRW